MAGGNPGHIGQADARAFELVLIVQALKYTEEFVGLQRIKPGAIVANKNDCFAV